MQNVLFVLSPLQPSLLALPVGVRAAMNLKAKGAIRADLTTDPRYETRASQRGQAHPVIQFNKSADSLASTVFRPVIGQSDVQDLKDVFKDLKSFSNAASLFKVAASGNAHNHREVGLVLYMAFHTSYDTLAFPGLSGQAKQVLNDFAPDTVSDDLDAYGHALNLLPAREKLKALRNFRDEAVAAYAPSIRLQ